MSDFNFYTANEVYAEKYFQLPKVFFTNEKYKKMSNDSKVAYAILKDRFSYSVKNKWVDKQNRIYFVFTVEELKSILNCAEGKVAKIKKELTEMNLLFQKRGGSTWVNGIKVNTPNKLYLGKPEATAKDVYLIDAAESQAFVGIANIANPEKSQHINKNLGIANIANPEKTNDIKGSTGIVNIADNLYYTSSLDTNRHNIDTKKDPLQDQLLLDNFEKIMKDNSIATFIPDRVLSLIKIFSSSYSEAQKTVKTIHNAKAKAEKDSQTKIIFEDLDTYGLNAEQELYQTLLKAYQKQKTEKVENIQNLIFVYVKNWFVENPIAAKQQAESSEELPTVSLHDWTTDVENSDY
ncbi:replication initiator protein A [Enterococcus mundtii]|uniref:Replication initiator protein A n=1 Tax=Enterococcus mundtii TaxID=53346 RepID=A0AAI8WF73_ENTMU|nr:replication initiator protein A [Enterococcus mundtii]BBM16255.1 replication initiator protein A [Enterococcus mundtii]